MRGTPRALVWFVVAAVVGGAISADAAERKRRTRPRAEQCPRAGTITVEPTRIVDGDTFITRDGREVDLTGVLARGSGGDRADPAQMQAARDALGAALAAGSVSLAVHGQPDRYGRLKAQVFAGADWIQAKLVSGGQARTAPDIASAACMPALLAIEGRAREAKAGHWGAGAFAVRSPDDLNRVTGTFQIVEGRVQSVAVVRGRVYLNFGPNWRTDFTATVAPGDKRTLRRRIDWKVLEGKRVRVRGWMEFYNGPMIALYAAGQIEFVDALPKPPRKPRKPRKPRAPKRAASP
jgi:endonuclease YncB( thermonuclease family)